MSELDLPFREVAPAALAPLGGVAEAALAVAGWCMLAGVDVALKVAGFHRFYKLVERCPTLGSQPAHRRDEVARRTCTAVDRARTYYFKRAWCLQRAAASVCMLRLRGIPAELVIGVRKIPFCAHAWTEVGRAVVADPPAVKGSFLEIVRC